MLDPQLVTLEYPPSSHRINLLDGLDLTPRPFACAVMGAPSLDGGRDIKGVRKTGLQRECGWRQFIHRAGALVSMRFHETVLRLS